MARTVALVGCGLVAAASVTVLLTAVSPAEPARTAVPVPEQTEQTGAAPQTRVTALRPFAADSPWNTALGSDARFAADDAPSTAELISPQNSVEVNSTSWSHPVVRATEFDPEQSVLLDSGTTLRYRIPQDAAPAAGDDAHLHVVDPDGRFVHEGWGMRRTGASSWSARYVAVVDLYGDGISGGSRAYGGSAIGGLIRSHEVDEGLIQHALALAVPRSDLQSGPVWPATQEDNGGNGTYAGHLPMGALIAIPSAVDLDTLNLDPDGLSVARALQDYGAYVVDSSGQFTLYAEPGADEARLDRMRTQLADIRLQLRVVDNNTPDNPGGPGVRRAPSATPLQGETQR